MSEVVERVAMALFENMILADEEMGATNATGWDRWDTIPEYAKGRIRRWARVSVAAMREPTPEMCDAGNKYDCAPLASEVWHAMIDEALK